ncbi:MAG: hypothetical protein AAGA86_11600, partial [Bacteroidota bacterium]
SDAKKWPWVDGFKSEGLGVKDLGILPEDRISEELYKSSLGITTTPMAQIEKSGTVAAMLEHQLPVICVARQWTPKRFPKKAVTKGVMEYTKGNLEHYLKSTPPVSEYPRLPKVAKLFEEGLMKHS